MKLTSAVFPARMDAFPGVATFLEEVCRLAGFSRPDALRLRLVVEELFTNTVSHGHGQDSDEPIRLGADAAVGRITLLYEDTGPRYDPLAAATPPDDSASVEERPVGGLGIALVSSLAEQVEYSYAQGRNRITLVMIST